MAFLLISVPGLDSSAQGNPAQAAAQTAAQEAARNQQRQQEEFERLQRSRDQALRSGGDPEPETDDLEPDNPDGFKIYFDLILIDDYTLLTPEFVAGVRLKYERRELGLEDVNNILRELTNRYIELGYITCRAYLPDQDITTGTLTIKCVEGELEDFSGATDPLVINTKTAFPGLKGRVLNLRDLEQGIDQLNRLPSNNATMNILPGEEFGGSLLDLGNDHGKRWRLQQSIDNGGFESTGEYQSRTTFQYDNGFELNDQLTATYGRDVTGEHDGHFSEMASAIFSVPYGYWLFDIGANYSSYLSEFAIERFDLSTSGETWNFFVGANYLFHRDQTSKSTFHFNLTSSITENFLNGFKLFISSRQLTIATIGVSHSDQIAGGQFYGRVDYARGLPIFNAFEKASRFGANQPYGEFGIFSTDLSYQKQIPISIPGSDNAIPMLWTSQFRAQYTPDRIFSTQATGLGGQGSIRGFRDETILAESGWYLRNDLAFPLGNFASQTAGLFAETSLFVAYDVGSGFGPFREENQKGLLQGTAGGFRFAKGKLNGELSVGLPLEAPEFIKSRDPIIYGSLTCVF